MRRRHRRHQGWGNVIDYENFNHESNLYDIDSRHMIGRTVKIGKARGTW